MGPRNSGVSFGSEGDVSIELLEQGKGSEATRMASISDSDWTDHPAKLPAKSLTLRSLTSRVRWMFWIGFVVIAIIVALSVLASEIFHFLPDEDDVILLQSPVSCDLTVGNGGIQGAFLINLRGATHLTFREAKAIVRVLSFTASIYAA